MRQLPPSNITPVFRSKGMRPRGGGRERRPNFLDIFCTQVGIRGPRRTSIKSGNRVEIEARRIGETAVIGPPRLSSCRSSLDRLSLPSLSLILGRSLIFSKIYLIIARLTTSSFTSEVDRVPTISRFHSAISAFRAPLRSEEWPTGGRRRAADCVSLSFHVGGKRGLAIYPRVYSRGLEIWTFKRLSSVSSPSPLPSINDRFQFRILFNRVTFMVVEWREDREFLKVHMNVVVLNVEFYWIIRIRNLLRLLRFIRL